MHNFVGCLIKQKFFGADLDLTAIAVDVQACRVTRIISLNFSVPRIIDNNNSYALAA